MWTKERGKKDVLPNTYIQIFVIFNYYFTWYTCGKNIIIAKDEKLDKPRTSEQRTFPCLFIWCVYVRTCVCIYDYNISMHYSDMANSLAFWSVSLSLRIFFNKLFSIKRSASNYNKYTISFTSNYILYNYYTKRS